MESGASRLPCAALSRLPIATKYDRLMAGIEPAESSHRRAADAHHMHAPHAHVHLCMWLQE